jgi:hypothetical protein
MMFRTKRDSDELTPIATSSAALALSALARGVALSLQPSGSSGTRSIASSASDRWRDESS